MGVSIKDNGGLQNLLKKVTSRANKAHVDVGIVATAKNAQKVAEYAKYLEYGWVQRVTYKQDKYFFGKVIPDSPIRPKMGASLVMPPRPTFHATARAYCQDWENTLKKGLKLHASGDLTMALVAVGEQAKADVQTTIANNGTGQEPFPDRSPVTMEILAAKTAGKVTDSSGGLSRKKALLRSRDFFNSIGYDIVSKK